MDVRHNLGMNQAQFADEIGVHQNTVYRWERGDREPRAIDLQHIASLAQVSVDWLLGREKPEADLSELLRDQQRRIDQGMREQKDHGNVIEVAAEDFVLVPVVGAASAGVGTWADQDIEEYLPVLREHIPAGCTPFFVRVVGDCMAHTAGIAEGDLVFVAKGLAARDGDIVVIVIDGEAKVKRLKRMGNQAVLISDHPDEPIQPAAEIEITGPVLWARREFRR